MKITAIQQQQKQANRYSIFVDGVYSFSLSDIGLLASHLAVGLELSKEDLKDLKKKVEADTYYSKVLNYLSIRPRSQWEVENYLIRKKCPENLSHEIRQKLIEKVLIDDVKFAISWIENRRLLKPVSKRRLIAELRAKRVSNDIISQTIADDEADERKVLEDLVEQKRRISRYQDDLKLMQYLSRQGFNYEDIKEVLKK